MARSLQDYFRNVPIVSNAPSGYPGMRGGDTRQSAIDLEYERLRAQREAAALAARTQLGLAAMQQQGTATQAEANRRAQAGQHLGGLAANLMGQGMDLGPEHLAVLGGGYGAGGTAGAPAGGPGPDARYNAMVETRAQQGLAAARQTRGEQDIRDLERMQGEYEQTGRMPSATTQVAGGQLMNWTGQDFNQAFGERGPMTPQAYSQRAGFHGDIYNQFGGGDVEVPMNAETPAGPSRVMGRTGATTTPLRPGTDIKGLADLRGAIRRSAAANYPQLAAPAAGTTAQTMAPVQEQLGPEGYNYVQQKMQGLQVRETPAEGPGNVPVSPQQGAAMEGVQTPEVQQWSLDVAATKDAIKQARANPNTRAETMQYLENRLATQEANPPQSLAGSPTNYATYRQATGREPLAAPTPGMSEVPVSGYNEALAAPTVYPARGATRLSYLDQLKADIATARANPNLSQNAQQPAGSVDTIGGGQVGAPTELYTSPPPTEPLRGGGRTVIPGSPVAKAKLTAAEVATEGGRIQNELAAKYGGPKAEAAIAGEAAKTRESAGRAAAFEQAAGIPSPEGVPSQGTPQQQTELARAELKNMPVGAPGLIAGGDVYTVTRDADQMGAILGRIGKLSNEPARKQVIAEFRTTPGYKALKQLLADLDAGGMNRLGALRTLVPNAPFVSGEERMRALEEATTKLRAVVKAAEAM